MCRIAERVKGRSEQKSTVWATIPAGLASVALSLALLTPGVASGRVVPGSLVGWGGQGAVDKGQTRVPPGNDYVAVEAGFYHSLALRANGSLVAWGDNSSGQCDVPVGDNHVAIEAGFSHCIALRADGTLAAWGSNADGQCNVPGGSDYVAITAGGDHCLAVKADGSVIAWGNNYFGQCNVPQGLICRAIAAGWRHSLALTTRGSLVAWGINNNGECLVPAGTDFVAIACGDHHNFARRTDGSVVAWGFRGNGRCDFPPGTEFPRAFRGGGHHSLVMKSDASLAAWGNCDSGECDCPAGTDYIAISAGTHHNLAIKAGGPPRAAKITMQYVTIGNPGNPDDVHKDFADRTYGGVPYVYRVGKYEVTAAQYCAFLNAVAADDPYGLYDPAMMETIAGGYTGCRIQRYGSRGNYIYGVPADWANRPVNCVNFWSACRFANWLHNGQPAGPQDANSTEDGAYTLNGYIGDDGRQITRNPGARVWIPSPDEWYKATYHNNDGVTGNYWDYPTRSDRRPSNDLKEPDPGNNANFFVLSRGVKDYTIGAPYWRTEVGEFENSAGPYGTYDQAGNIREWTDALIRPDRADRTQHGACYGTQTEDDAREMGSHAWNPQVANMIVGFRVAAEVLKSDITGSGGKADSMVNFADFAALAQAWLTSHTDDLWRADCDLSGDGEIDALDLRILGESWLMGTGE